MKVQAKYDFRGNPNESQLTFPAGAVIEQSSSDAEIRNGWMYGTYQGQQGWFPENYVQPMGTVPPSSMAASMPPMGKAPFAPSAAAPQLPEANMVMQVTMVPLSASAPPMAMASAIPIKEDDSKSSSVPLPLPPPPKAKTLSDNQISQLVQQGFTKGLALSLNDSLKTFAMRIWIVDNSGSMQKTDGHRLVETGQRQQNVKFVQCSRWEEITECVCYHIQLAALLQAPTSFRLLNDPGAHIGPQQFTIDTTPEYTTANNFNTVIQPQQAVQIIRQARPGGCTPLTAHILAIQAEVEAMAPQLRSYGQKVAIVIATDGLPTDERGYGAEAHQQQFVNALRMLEGFPVWLVIRLCTDEDDVVKFYNNLDQLLELSMEVLDDFTAEAEEVHEFNPWLNYALPLHRMREMGYQDRIFDMLDERALTRSELRDFCGSLLGDGSVDRLPDPSVEWAGFLRRLDSMMKYKEQVTEPWNPMKKKRSPWLDLRKMNRSYGDGSCVIL